MITSILAAVGGFVAVTVALFVIVICASMLVTSWRDNKAGQLARDLQAANQEIERLRHIIREERVPNEGTVS